MEYRVLAFNGSQYLVKSGDSIQVNGLLGTVDQTFTAKTLLTVVDDQIQLGHPHLPDPTTLKLTALTKSPKIEVSTYRAKSRYRRHHGHRQGQSVLLVTPAASPKAPPKPKTRAKKVAPSA